MRRAPGAALSTDPRSPATSSLGFAPTARTAAFGATLGPETEGERFEFSVHREACMVRRKLPCRSSDAVSVERASPSPGGVYAGAQASDPRSRPIHVEQDHRPVAFPVVPAPQREIVTCGGEFRAGERGEVLDPPEAAVRATGEQP